MRVCKREKREETDLFADARGKLNGEGGEGSGSGYPLSNVTSLRVSRSENISFWFVTIA